mgnify:CR=1 FL=1
MKQIFTLALTFLLVFTLVTVTAFAADTTTINGESRTATKEVTASYRSGAGGGTVYSVDITWGSMAFTYSAGSGRTWNPATHTYSSGGAGGWSNSGNTVTVTNHSNAQVTAKLDYASETGFTGISGSFGNKSTMTLKTAEGTQFANAPTDTAALTLSGALASTVSDSTQIGTITVTIN